MQHTHSETSHLIDRWSLGPSASGRNPERPPKRSLGQRIPFKGQSSRPRHNSIQAIEEPCLVLGALLPRSQAAAGSCHGPTVHFAAMDLRL